MAHPRNSHYHRPPLLDSISPTYFLFRRIDSYPPLRLMDRIYRSRQPALEVAPLPRPANFISGWTLENIYLEPGHYVITTLLYCTWGELTTLFALLLFNAVPSSTRRDHDPPSHFQRITPDYPQTNFTPVPSPCGAPRTSRSEDHGTTSLKLCGMVKEQGLLTVPTIRTKHCLPLVGLSTSRRRYSWKAVEGIQAPH